MLGTVLSPSHVRTHVVLTILQFVTYIIIFNPPKSLRDRFNYYSHLR